jgi:hypothetical protein
MSAGLAYSNVYVEEQPGPIYGNKENKNRNYLWIFGGKGANGISSSVWKAHLNKMVFNRW